MEKNQLYWMRNKEKRIKKEPETTFLIGSKRSQGFQPN